MASETYWAFVKQTNGKDLTSREAWLLEQRSYAEENLEAIVACLPFDIWKEIPRDKRNRIRAIADTTIMCDPMPGNPGHKKLEIRTSLANKQEVLALLDEV